jgi:hypothetical protein
MIVPVPGVVGRSRDKRSAPAIAPVEGPGVRKTYMKTKVGLGPGHDLNLVTYV